MSIRVVSEQSPEDVAAKRAKEAAERAEGMARHALRELAANLLRIARGAGRPYDVEVQAGAFLDACEEYRQITGHGLSTYAVHDMLRVRNYLSTDHEWTGEQHMRNEGQESMVSGALQAAASRLVDQKAQEMRGLDEMLRGQRTLEELHEEERNRWRKTPPSSPRRRGS